MKSETCLHGRSNHGHKGHKDGTEDIDDGEDEVHLEKNMIHVTYYWVTET